MVTLRGLLVGFTILLGMSLSPGHPASTLAQPTPLADVHNWLYLIDVELTDALLDQITVSAYDLVVLDYIPSDVSTADYPMASTVTRLHSDPHPKQVIAYIDVGQAEDFRTYWQPDWEIGNPEWILGSDPEGWQGDFPVAYWAEDWRAIWLAEDGLLRQIVDAGFDGVYLDWIEAYYDDNVLAAANRDGVDARQESNRWVRDLAVAARALKPGFLIIAQNAADLAEDPTYVEAVDAIAQEQIWFDGGADNEPPGDCPLPRTEDAIDSASYVGSLTGGCLRLYEDDPESTLHSSSEAYIESLQAAQEQGLVIFTVDYAEQPAHIKEAVCESRRLGFVPFVGTRGLNHYIPPLTDLDCSD